MLAMLYYKCACKFVQRVYMIKLNEMYGKLSKLQPFINIEMLLLLFRWPMMMISSNFLFCYYSAR